MVSSDAKQEAEWRLSQSRPKVEKIYLPKGTTVVNILGSSVAKKPVSGSFIKHWEDQTKCERGMCVALKRDGSPCGKRATGGGHIKVAGGPVRSLFKVTWFIIPTCPDHNKGLSCKTYKVQAVTAVEAPPSFKERVLSWGGEVKKLAETIWKGWQKARAAVKGRSRKVHPR